MAMQKLNSSAEVSAYKEDSTLKISDESNVGGYEDILTHEQTVLLMRILMYGVTPGVSILGVIGNIFSLIILYKHGLHKCSNILLFSLAITDLTFLVTFNSLPKILYEMIGTEFAFDYSRGVSKFMFIWWQIFNVLDYGMGWSSLTFPMLITFERLIAVYFPFKFQLIITPTRTWCAVACVYIMWYTIVIYMSFWFTFEYNFDPVRNISVGVKVRSSLYNDTYDTVMIVQKFINTVGLQIPPLVTLVGCIFIGVKIRLASKKRTKMTQANAKEASSNRTTKMLLAVCVVYTITCAVISLPTYIPQYSYYTLLNDAPSNFGRVMYQVINIFLCMNSSANFLVYVLMNKNFRDTYVSLFTGVCGRGNRRA